MADSTPRCLNCGASLSGVHCSTCGQKANTGRLTVRHALRAATGEIFELESPLLRTAWNLTWRPGWVCAEYIAGRRTSFTNPVKYAFIMGAVLVVMMELFDVHLGDIMSQPFEEQSEVQSSMRTLLDWLQRYTQVTLLMTMPFLAALLRLFFIWIDRNIAEHLVLCLYVYGHNSLIQALLVPFGGSTSPAAALVISSLAFIYLSWAAVRTTGLRWYVAVPVSFAAHLVLQATLGIVFAVAMLLL
jgi:Protein of unknown function (DUF3667)